MVSNKELIDTLKKASESQDNIALKMLLIMAAERIECSVLYGTEE